MFSAGPTDGSKALTATKTWQAGLVSACAVVMVLGTLAGFGLLGTRVEESSGGAFAADATLVTPASPAFSIWSLIYLGLLGYVVWQWRASARAARVWWLAGASMLLNALWLGVTQVGWLWASVVVILGLALVLGLLMRRLGESRPASTVEAILLDGAFGVYLGWVSVAAVANVTAVLVAGGVDPGWAWSEALAVVVLAVAGLLGSWFAVRLGGRWAVAAAMAWALAWISVGRLTDSPRSLATAIAAIAAGLLILAVTAAARARRGLSGRPATPAVPMGARHG